MKATKEFDEQTYNYRDLVEAIFEEKNRTTTTPKQDSEPKNTRKMGSNNNNRIKT
jgi:hypothetical protein